MRFMILLTATLLVGSSLFGPTTQNAWADCDGCRGGCSECCDMMCKLVTTTRTIKVVCWGCECDQVCVPCRSSKGCTNCDSVTGKGGTCSNQGPCCLFRWTDWTAGGATVKHRKKLVKYIATKKVPSYKWIVVKGSSCSGSDTIKPVPASARLGDQYNPTDDEVKSLNRGIAPLPPKYGASRQARSNDSSLFGQLK